MQIRQEQRIKSFPSQLQPVVVFVSCQPPSYKADLAFLQLFEVWLCATWFEILWDSRCWQQAWTLFEMIIKLLVFLSRKCVKCGILKSQSGAWVFRAKKIIVQFLSLEGWSSLLKYRARSALLPPEHNWHMCTGGFRLLVEILDKTPTPDACRALNVKPTFLLSEGGCQKLLSGFFPLGGGVPPHSAKLFLGRMIFP